MVLTNSQLLPPIADGIPDYPMVKMLGHAVCYTRGKLKFLPRTTKILLLEMNYVTRDYH